jgi:hypothetical protein
MNKNRTSAKIFAGLLMVSAFTAASIAPAQARDTGWDLKAPTSTHAKPGALRLSDTGWD